MFVAGEAPSLEEQWAAQLTLSSPLGKEDRGREKEQRSRGKGGCHRASWTRAAARQGSVEDWRAPHGPTASRAAAGVEREEMESRGGRKTYVASRGPWGRWGP